jgi:hypothetical protein
MDVLRLFGAFSIVFGLLGGFWIFVKLRKPTPLRIWRASSWNRQSEAGTTDLIVTSTLSILRQVRLTPTHQLHLILSGKERFLICTHPQGCTPIPLALVDFAKGMPTEWRDQGLNDAA